MAAPQQSLKDEELMRDFRKTVKTLEIRAYCGRPFLQIAKLRAWLVDHDEALLYAAYRGSEDDFLPITIDDVREKRLSIFVLSILLELGHGDKLHVFHRLQLVDLLPIDLRTLEERLVGSEIQGKDLKVLTEGFNELQWRYCPVIFQLRHSQDYVPNCVIPILRRQAINLKGGTANVWQVEVLEEFVDEKLRKVVASSRFDRGEDGLGWRYNFALKTFKDGFKAEYDNEIIAFRALEGREGIIAYFGHYNHQEPISSQTTFNIILEFGELDLDEYFFDRSPPILPAEIRLFWKDLFVVAKAVKGIHTFEKRRGDVTKKYSGWHADIKPDNILLVRGTFKLADPGFAKFEPSEAFERMGKRDQTKRDHTTMIHGGTQTFGAPECHLAQGKSVPVPRSIDIWSLGCVFSVTASWVILGEQGVLQFGNLRTRAIRRLDDNNPAPAPDYFHDGNKILQDVLDWHNYLRSICRRSDDVTSKVLDFVDKHMLRSEPEERMEAAKLCDELDKILANSSTSHFELPKSLRDALRQTDAKAPEQPNRSKINNMHPLTKSQAFLGVEVTQDRKERKSIRLADRPLLKTTNRSEVLGPEPQPSQDSTQVATTKAESKTLKTPLPTTKEHIPELKRTKSVRPSAKPTGAIKATGTSKAAATTKNGPEEPVPARPGPFVTKTPTMLTEAPIEPPTGPEYDKQNVWQARADIERRRGSTMLSFGTTKKDKLLTAHFVNRDIQFLVDNASSMAEFWDEAAFLLETLVMKAAGQDKDGIDLMFANGPIVLNSKKAADFRKIMEDPQAKPTAGSNIHSDIRRALGKILDRYLQQVRDSLENSKKRDKLKDLTIVIFTDGMWDGIRNKNEVGNAIVRFAKDLKSIQGRVSTRMRQVSFEFVQFGFDPNATYRLKSLDDELPHMGIEDIVDTEPSLGNVNKMLLGSFVPGFDEQITEDLIKVPLTPKERGSYVDEEARARNSILYSPQGSTLASSPPPLVESPPPLQVGDRMNSFQTRQITEKMHRTPSITVHHAREDSGLGQSDWDGKVG